MVSIYDKNFREFAFTVDELQVLQCKKMKFRNAWPWRYVDILLYAVSFANLSSDDMLLQKHAYVGFRPC